MAGKYYYGVPQLSIEEAANGKFPEKTGEHITFYESHQQAIDALKKVNGGETYLLGHGLAAVLPGVAALYTCELYDSQIEKMTNKTPNFGSKGIYQGPVPKGAIISSQWAIGADMLHQNSLVTQTEHGVTKNDEMKAIAKERLDDFKVLAQAFSDTPADEMKHIDPREPSTLRAITEVYGEQGFMKRAAEDLPFEQFYVQQMMRPMVEGQGLHISLQTDVFHMVYNSNLDSIEAANPGLSPAELARTAMGQTIREFQENAVMRSNLKEQLLFNEMASMHNAMSQFSREGDMRDKLAIADFMERAMKAPGEHPDYDTIAEDVARNEILDELDIVNK